MLACFCRAMVVKYESPTAIGSDALAQEFADYFWMSPQPTLMEFHQLCQQLGIDIAAKDLPADIGAHHYAYHLSGKYRLEYNREQWAGTSVFKVGHDLCEIIQETFEKICPGYKAPRNPALPTCMAPYANKFAAALVMNKNLMRRAVFETGFDIVALHHRFEKAYSAVAIRVVEVLREVPENNIDVLIAIYERSESERDISLWQECCREKFQARYVAKTPGISRLFSRGWAIKAPHYPRHLLPEAGDPVVPGGVVDAVLNGGHPLYVQRVTGFDLWGFNDLACLAVPVFWYTKEGSKTVLAKVILTVMPCEQTTMLQPQLQKIKPDIIPEQFQFI